MRIVFPDGAGCVQHPSELEPLRPAEAVVLDYSEMDAEVLRACERLRFVSFLGIGYNSCIDVAEATRRGIDVAYTPDYGATSVAEHALAMILALTRQIGPAFVSAREGRWEPGRFQGMELRGKTLGIVGLGPIGTEMARLGAGLGMRLIGWTRRPSPARAQHGLTLVSLDDLFSTADVVTLHLAYTPESQGLISRALLERMKPEAWFVNTARAKIVDNVALVELLRAGRIRGAALDVHDTEPIPAGDYVMRTLPNVLITPHIGYNTREAASNMLRIAIATVEAFAKGQRLHVVNGI